MGHKIVFTNGCFDLFHAGHLNILKYAKKLGDELHVGINSDISIRKIKGPTRPIISEKQRFAIIAAIKYVDFLYLFDELTPKRLIEEIKPDIVVKGGDFKPQDVVGAHVAKIVIVPLTPGISTTKIIEKIKRES